MIDKLLCSRIDDMLFRAERGEAAYGSFLNETERAEAELYLRGRARDLAFRFFGGYEDAERTRLFIYPDYYEFGDICDCIRAVEIRGSGYESLRHSSFLGALTSLGIDRARMGDIVIREHSAILFADEKIAEFLLSEPAPLTRVGRDTVRIYEYEVPEDFGNHREYKDVFDTVASPRLDCVVSALINLGREKAKSLIISGQVMVNHITEEKTDTAVDVGDVVTVRSYGKFRIESLFDKTKKDRYKLIAKKYI
ncbi:MAG: hypothetical protein IJB57_05295 [Clostridia bacterium]|nr:hypothetical protein [Clostridia bacterium]